MGDASPADGFAGGGGSDTVHGTGPLVPSVEWVVLAVGLGEIAAKGKYWNPCLYLLPLYLFPISPHWKWEYLTWSSIKFTPVILHVNLNCVRDKYLMSKVLLLGRTIFMKSGTNIFCLIVLCAKIVRTKTSWNSWFSHNFENPIIQYVEEGFLLCYLHGVDTYSL